MCIYISGGPDTAQECNIMCIIFQEVLTLHKNGTWYTLYFRRSWHCTRIRMQHDMHYIQEVLTLHKNKNASWCALYFRRSWHSTRIRMHHDVHYISGGPDTPQEWPARLSDARQSCRRDSRSTTNIQHIQVNIQTTLYHGINFHCTLDITYLYVPVHCTICNSIANFVKNQIHNLLLIQ